MAQRFLSIKNFEKYQSLKYSTAPWFKLQKSFFGDREVTKLPIPSRFLYIGLIYLATECNNKVYNDKTWIAQRLYISPTEVNLTPLYKAGFLSCSNVYRELGVEWSGVERSGVEGDPPPATHKPQQKKRPISETDKPTEKHFSLGKSLGVDVGPEWGKFKNYCLAHDKRYANFEAAFRNWLATAADMKERNRHVVR